MTGKNVIHKTIRPGVRLAAVILIGLQSVLPAAAENSSSAPLVMDTMIVTAEHQETDFQTGDVDVEATSTFCTVIERDQFESKMEGLAEVIEKEAGIQVRQSGGLGSFSTMTLRGSTSEQVMIYLDGILLNDASGGGVDLSNISLSDVAAIEIYRGSAPINFGRSSIGGVVNIKTFRSQKTLDMNASAGYGSFHTRSFSGFINHKPGNWDYLVSVDYLDSDNDFEFTYDNQTQYNKADDRTVKRNNARLDQSNILAKLGYDAEDNLRVDFSHHWFSKDQGLPRFNNSPEADTTLDTEYHISTLKLTADNLTSLGINTSTKIDYTRKTEEYDDSQGDIGLGHQRLRYDTDKYGGSTYLETISDANVLSMTIDAHRETYAPKNLLSSSDLDKSRRDQLSAGLQYRVALLQDQIMITPVLRYSHIKDKLSPTEDFLDNSPEDKTAKTDDYFLPQIGIDFRPLPWLTVKSNLGRYQRQPTFFELFGDRGFFLGNDDLAAEEGTNFDLGLECSWQIDSSPITGISLGAVYFRNNVDDLITRVYDARGIGRSENISGSLINGVEAQGRINFCRYFTLTVNATLQDTENQSHIPAFDGKQLPGRFESSYLGRLEAKYSGVKVFLEHLSENDMYYDTANLLKAAVKEEFNAGVSWLYKAVLISLEAKNLADNQYEDFNGYPLPGRSFTFKIKYTL